MSLAFLPRTHRPFRGHRAARLAVSRSRRDEELLRSGDLELLLWLAEQGAAKSDQLAVLLGCSARTVQRTLARLREHRLIYTQRLLADEAAWVTPTPRGLRVCGSPFSPWRPRLDLIRHTAAVNDVRIHIQH